MAYTHPFGRPIVGLKFTNGNNVFVNTAEIKKLLNHHDVKDRNIVVFSIIGAFRGGKSFFLDYCLRFLYAHYPSISNPNRPTRKSNWMGEPDDPLQGFSWRSGVDRDTTGIVMWSDIFLHTMENNKKIAILVVDTQGLFDDQSTTADNFKMFALGSLLSSIQVLNLSIRIQEDQLQYLHFATDFAQCIGNNPVTGVSNEKPFQKLIFLIRDFANQAQYAFGIDGGRQYITRVLNNNQANQNIELQSVRQHITNTFDKIDCCLLPRPGDTVCEDDTYNGCLSAIPDRFKVEFKKVIEHLLIPNNLITKRINGQEITGAQMKEYIDTYFRLIQSNDIEIKSFAEGTIDNYMNHLINKCAAEYKLAKYKYEDIKEDDNISEMHENYKKNALKFYDKEKKMGNQEHVMKFKGLLKQKINKEFNQWKLQMISIAREKKQTFEAEEAKKEAEKAREATEKQLQQMQTMFALSCATSVLNTGLSAFSRSGNSPVFIPSGGSSMMPDVVEMMLGLRDKMRRKQEIEESKSSKAVFEKFLSLSSNEEDDSDEE